MQTLIALLALAAIILLFAGLIRPRWAFLRARWQVLIAYSAALTVLGVLANVVVPPDDLAAARDQAPAAVTDSAPVAAPASPAATPERPPAIDPAALDAAQLAEPATPSEPAVQGAEKPGLGLSRRDAVAFFGAQGLRLEPSSDVGGQERWMTPNPEETLIMVEAIGPEDDLVSLNYIAGLVKGDMQRVADTLLAMKAVADLVLPQWEEDSGRWIIDAMESVMAGQAQTKEIDDKTVTLRYIQALGFLSLSIKS